MEILEQTQCREGIVWMIAYHMPTIGNGYSQSPTTVMFNKCREDSIIYCDEQGNRECFTYYNGRRLKDPEYIGNMNVRFYDTKEQAQIAYIQMVLSSEYKWNRNIGFELKYLKYNIQTDDLLNYKSEQIGIHLKLKF